MPTVDEYIAAQSAEAQPILMKIRSIIKESSPDAVESISYGIPGYKLRGKPLIYFAAFKHHIGLYATPSGHEYFANEFSVYKQGKGSVQFPLNQPVPYDLIRRVVEYKVRENQVKNA